MHGIAAARQSGLLFALFSSLFLVAISSLPARCFSQQPDEPTWRLWTDNTGKFEVFARLDSADDQGVRLVLGDGRKVTVAWRRLSPSDAAWVTALQADQMNEQPAESHPSTPLLPTGDGTAGSPETVSALPGSATAEEAGLPAGDSILDPAPIIAPPPSLALPALGNHRESAKGDLELPVERKPIPAEVPGPDLMPMETPEPVLVPGPENEADLVPPSGNPNPVPPSLQPPAISFENGLPTASPVNRPALVEPEALADSPIPSPDHENEPSANASGSSRDRPAEASPPPEGVLILPEAGQGLAAQSGVMGQQAAQISPTSTLSPVLRRSLDSFLDQINAAKAPSELRELLTRISQFPIPVDDPRTLESLRRCLISEDKVVRETAFQMLIQLSSRIETSVLRDMLLDQSQSIRWKAYNVLIREPRDELLDLVVGGMSERDRNKIVGVLRAYGSKAEEPVLPLLASLQPEVRIEVARLLGEIGTSGSIGPLKAMADDQTLPLVERLQAKAAISLIEGRNQ